MKKNVLLLLVSLMMACIVTGCSEEEDLGYYFKGDELVLTKSGIKYTPRDIKDLPEFLHAGEMEAKDDFLSWFACHIWTGKYDGIKYYVVYNMLSSQGYGSVYSETGEPVQLSRFDISWTDIEVIWIHPKYIEYCKTNKLPLRTIGY